MGTGGPLSRPIPVARSILWAPAAGGRRPGDIPFPVFLSQPALTAIHEHVAAPVGPGQGILGFLLGDLCECPETNVSYLVIDAALRLTQTIYADRSRDVVTRIWDRIEAQLEEQKAHLIGWYHTHAPLPLTLSPDDVETHEQYFGEPWQVAMLVATEAGESAGAFFRADSDEWVSTPLPFYELLKDDSIRPDGKKRSFVTWKNYRAYSPTAPQAPPAEPKVTRTAPHGAPEPEPEPESPPPPPPPPVSRPPRVSRPEERTSELKFLTTAEDFAEPLPPRAAPVPRAAPPRRAQPPPPPPPEREPEPEPVPEEAEPVEAESVEAESLGAEVEPGAPEWPAEFEDFPQQGEEAVFEEPLPEPEPPKRRRRRKSRKGLWRMVFALVLVAGAGAAYWWFQPQLPSVNWSANWSAITNEWSVLKGKVSTLVGRLRRARPAPAPRPSPAVRPPPRAKAVSPTPAQPMPTGGPPGSPAASATSPPAPAALPAPRAPSPYATLDRIGDELALVVRAFGDRATQFDRKQLECAELAHALGTVEQRWVAYTTTRRTAGVLDGAHAARDQKLYAGVDSVERRFERSGCERP